VRGGHLARSVAPPVSTGLLHDRPGHVRALTTWRASDVAPLVRAIATASFASAHNGRILVRDLAGVRHRWAGVITTRRDFAVHGLRDVLVRQPVVDNHCRTVLGSTGANAQLAFGRVEDVAVRLQVGARCRNRMGEVHEVTAALDAFSARARYQPGNGAEPNRTLGSEPPGAARHARGVGVFAMGVFSHVISSLVTPQVRKAEELTGLKRDQIPSSESAFMRWSSGCLDVLPTPGCSCSGLGFCSSE
jgi:hypothetical protein